MAKLSDYFPSKFLKAADLNGRAVRVTIDQVVLETIGQGERRPVLYFKGRQKGLVLNKTNADRLADAYGDDEAAVVGQTVELYPDRTHYQGKLVDCVRLRAHPQRRDEAGALDDADSPF
jgi:hypothetical protein